MVFISSTWVTWILLMLIMIIILANTRVVLVELAITIAIGTHYFTCAEDSKDVQKEIKYYVHKMYGFSSSTLCPWFR